MLRELGKAATAARHLDDARLARDEAIMAARLVGATLDDIAAVTGLSAPGVKKVLTRLGGDPAEHHRNANGHHRRGVPH